MWIRTVESTFVNSDHVVEISPHHSGEKSVLRLVDGKTAVAWSEPFELRMGLNPVIPAQPGFEVLYLNNPGEEPAFGRDPVIAWCASVGSYAMIAITPSRSTLDSPDGVAILYPDGQVYAPAEDRDFPDADAWVAHERKANAIAAMQVAARASSGR
jgi:hypothetical protein